MCWDTLSGATLSSCEWLPSDAEADIAMQSEGSLVDWAAVPSDLFQCSVNAAFEGLTPLERAMGHAPSPTSQQRHTLPRSSAPKELLVMMRGGTTKEPLDMLACVFGGSSTGGVSLGSSRKVGSKKKVIQVLEEARPWRHTLLD